MALFSRVFGRKKHSLNQLPKKIQARVAIYDSPGVAPRVINITSEDIQHFMNDIASTTYTLAREKGSGIPFTALKELAENLIHAGFSEVVISISPDGNTISFSDKGSGIINKEKAMSPGYSSADIQLKQYIKGVGSGLPVAFEAVKTVGGKLFLDDNLQGGAVITLSIPSQDSLPTKEGVDFKEEEYNSWSEDDPRQMSLDSPPINPASQAAGLSRRQEMVFILLGEHREIGPSSVAREASISLSTAYRDLVFLEQLGLLESRPNGKRVVTPQGQALLAELKGKGN